jgi:hypothetical protein
MLLLLFIFKNFLAALAAAATKNEFAYICCSWPGAAAFAAAGLKPKTTLTSQRQVAVNAEA